VHQRRTVRAGVPPAAGVRGRSVGTLRGHRAGILQLLVLGERLLSLGADQRLLVWAVGDYGAPLVRARPASAHTRVGLAARVRRRSPVRLRAAHSALLCSSLSTCQRAEGARAVPGTHGVAKLVAGVARLHSPSCRCIRWSAFTPELAARAPCQASIALGDDFQPTCMAHPDTYLNKVVVGGADGRLQLWNFASGQRLFEFRPARCAVRCLAASPALDVVGIGLADGRAPVLGAACCRVPDIEA
jgi:hypothetical protein